MEKIKHQHKLTLQCSQWWDWTKAVALLESLDDSQSHFRGLILFPVYLRVKREWFYLLLCKHVWLWFKNSDIVQKHRFTNCISLSQVVFFISYFERKMFPSQRRREKHAANVQADVNQRLEWFVFGARRPPSALLQHMCCSITKQPPTECVFNWWRTRLESARFKNSFLFSTATDKVDRVEGGTIRTLNDNESLSEVTATRSERSGAQPSTFKVVMETQINAAWFDLSWPDWSLFKLSNNFLSLFFYCSQTENWIPKEATPRPSDRSSVLRQKKILLSFFLKAHPRTSH